MRMLFNVVTKTSERCSSYKLNFMEMGCLEFCEERNEIEGRPRSGLVGCARGVRAGGGGVQKRPFFTKFLHAEFARQSRKDRTDTKPANLYSI